MEGRLGLGIDEDVVPTVHANVTTAMAGVDAESGVVAKISPEESGWK